MTSAKELCERKKRSRAQAEEQVPEVEQTEQIAHKKKKKEKKKKKQKVEEIDENIDCDNSENVCSNNDELDKNEMKKAKKRKREKIVDEDSSESVNKKSKVVSDHESIECVAAKSSDEKLNRKKKKAKNSLDIDDDIDKSDSTAEIDKQDRKVVSDSLESDDQKSKKKSKKVKKKDKKKSSGHEDESSKPASELAIEYLNQWKDDRSNWHFQKVRQVWLLQNMYSALVSEANFATLLDYLSGMKGYSREKTIEDAEVIMKADDDNETDSKNAVTDVKVERARQIIQMLS